MPFTNTHAAAALNSPLPYPIQYELLSTTIAPKGLTKTLVTMMGRGVTYQDVPIKRGVSTRLFDQAYCLSLSIQGFLTLVDNLYESKSITKRTHAQVEQAFSDARNIKQRGQDGVLNIGDYVQLHKGYTFGASPYSAMACGSFLRTFLHPDVAAKQEQQWFNNGPSIVWVYDFNDPIVVKLIDTLLDEFFEDANPQELVKAAKNLIKSAS